MVATVSRTKDLGAVVSGNCCIGGCGGKGCGVGGCGVRLMIDDVERDGMRTLVINRAVTDNVK